MQAKAITIARSERPAVCERTVKLCDSLGMQYKIHSCDISLFYCS